VDNQMEKAFFGVQIAMYSVVTPPELLTVIFQYTASCIDGFLFFIEKWMRTTKEGGFGYEISSPASIFIKELTAFFVVLRHIVEVIHYSTFEKVLDFD
jgi:hypothetical protein